MVTVKATRRFHYGGKDIKVGDLVEMSPLDASVHGRKRNVSLSKQDKPPTPQAAPAATYRTTAIQPEAPAEAVPVRAKRAYRRRDMVAEGAPPIVHYVPPTTDPE